MSAQVLSFLIQEKQAHLVIDLLKQFEMKALNVVYCAVHCWVKDVGKHKQGSFIQDSLRNLTYPSNFAVV
jgi:hypothetical protein